MDKHAFPGKTEIPQVSGSLDLVFDSKLSYLPSLTRLVEGLCKLVGLHETMEYEIVLAVNELVSNSIQHAYLEEADNQIKFNIVIDRDRFGCELIEENPLVSQDKVVITSVDDFMESGGEEGFGVALIYRFMDDVRREPIENGFKWVLERKLR